ncbi:hypothetical protein BD309DRAFT_1023856 [Dichomitus squalens]|nr:hypothetical protein BD309DRAFT_1023856 [Dichomitus squalens]
MERNTSLSNIHQYLNWAAQMKGYLIMIGSWSVTNLTPTTPDNAEVLKEHNLKVQRAQGIIMMKVDCSLHCLLEDDAGNLKQLDAMWTALKDNFSTPDATAVWYKFESLIASDRMND